MIDADTLRQLESLTPSNRPLLVCDVDEVILHLVAPFEEILSERGFVMQKSSMRLTGNVFHQNDGRPASQEEIWSALDLLFHEQDLRQKVVNGASEALRELSHDIDIVLLTNLPHKYGDIRRNYLLNMDISYPVVTNSGAKGPALKWFEDKWNSAIAFIDDTPQHLESVGKYTPATHLFHFMADDDFRQLMGSLDGVLLSTGDWMETGNAVRGALMEKDNG